MFYGSHTHSLDEKNRFTLPAKFRDAVNLEAEGHKFCLARGYEKTIFMFPPSAFREFVDRVERGGSFTQHRDFKIKFLASVRDAAIDAQGRITLPQNLLELAQIQKEIVVIGAIRWIEIWAKERWDEFETKGEEVGEYDLHARELFEGGGIA